MGFLNNACPGFGPHRSSLTNNQPKVNLKMSRFAKFTMIAIVGVFAPTSGANAHASLADRAGNNSSVGVALSDTKAADRATNFGDFVELGEAYDQDKDWL